MKHSVFYLAYLVGFWGFSQNNDALLAERYKDYREDQFYASFTYNLLNNKPDDVSQSGFSSGFHLGFIRDMPINKRRNVALGLGLGLSFNSYNQKNILINSVNGTPSIAVIDESDYDVSRNRFSTYLVEVPFQLRWRTSKATSYNFWRIYTGFKVGYLIYNSTNFKSDETNVRLTNSAVFNNVQYGVTFSAGYATWNFYAYYGLNSIFDKDNTVNPNKIDMSSFKIGLMFYVL